MTAGFAGFVIPRVEVTTLQSPKEHKVEAVNLTRSFWFVITRSRQNLMGAWFL